MRTQEEPWRPPPTWLPPTTVGYSDESQRLAVILTDRPDAAEQMREWAIQRGFEPKEPSDYHHFNRLLADPCLYCVCAEVGFYLQSEVQVELIDSCIGINLSYWRKPEHDKSRSVRLIGFFPKGAEGIMFDPFDMHVTLSD